MISLVPLYVLMQRLGWLSTYQGLIMPEARDRLRRLPAAAVLPQPADASSRTRPGSTGRTSWQIFCADPRCRSRQPALAALAIFAFRISVERLHLAADRDEQAEMSDAAGRARPAARATTGRVVRPDHGRCGVSALPLLVVFLVANRHIVEGVQLSGLG